jgi:hypothetical protein
MTGNVVFEKDWEKCFGGKSEEELISGKETAMIHKTQERIDYALEQLQVTALR